MISRRTIVALIVLPVLTLLAYAPLLRGNFVWGDTQVIARHAAVPSPWKSIWSFPTVPTAATDLSSASTTAYAPVPNTLFWLEHAAWGNFAPAYHATSMGLHIVAAWLLWALLRRLGLQWGALLGAALFSVHPLNVESIAWIAQQGQIVATIFALIAALCWVRWMGLRPARLEAAAPAARSPITGVLAYSAALASAVLAALSHPIALVLPVGLLLIAWLRHGRLTRRIILGIFPFLILAGTATAWNLAHAEFSTQLPLAGHAILSTFATIFWPSQLSWIHPAPAAGPVTWGALAVIAVALVIAYRLRRRITRGPVTGGIFFVAALLVATLTLTPAEFAFSATADRLAYIAGIGVLAAIAAAVTQVVRKHPRRASAILGAAIVVVAALTLLSARRAWQFAQPERLYRDTLATNPRSPVAAEALGDLLFARHDAASLDEAAALYTTALEVDARRTTAARSYAALLATQGKPRQAQEVLRKALFVRPEEPYANAQLADMVMGTVGTAAYPHVQPLYERAVAGAPELGSAASRLADIYESQLRVADACAVLEKALVHNSQSPALHLQLARLHTTLKEFDKADRHFDIANALDSKNHAAREQWGDMLLQANRPRDAEAQFRRALNLAGANATYHLQLGRALRAQKKLGSALNEFETAQSLDEKLALAWVESGDTYLLHQDEEKAEQFYRAALRVDSRFTPALVALSRLYLTSGDAERHNVYRGITLLRDAVEATRGEDLSVLVAYGIALGAAREYDQAIAQIDKAIALGKRTGLPPDQNELLLRSRSQFEIASAAPSDGIANSGAGVSDSRISLKGTGLEEDRERPFPQPQQRSVGDLVTRPLDLSVAPTPDEIRIPTAPVVRPFGTIIIPPPPKPDAPAATQPASNTRTGPAR